MLPFSPTQTLPQQFQDAYLALSPTSSQGVHGYMATAARKAAGDADASVGNVMQKHSVAEAVNLGLLSSEYRTGMDDIGHVLSAALRRGESAALGSKSQLGGRKRRWYLGIQSKKDPGHVMIEVLRALQALQCPRQR